MKLIHCADLHLDSKMGGLPQEKIKKRRQELVSTFERMVTFAAENAVSVILISGDLFDTASVTRTTRHAVLSAIRSNPAIRFYYVPGNHDRENFLSEEEELPENLHVFGTDWQTFEEAGNVTVTGVQFGKIPAEFLYASLVLPADRYNIVMLHGQESVSAQKDKTEVIPIKTLRNKQIDYLALGHVHAQKFEKLDARGVYCYPGCLEGRGFDECGEHGFMLLDVNPDGGHTETFVPFAGRSLYTVEVDISGLYTSFEIAGRINDELAAEGIGTDSLIKVVLTGEVDVTCEKNLAYLENHLSDYYFARVQDETKLSVDLEDYLHDMSLKGEFFRTVMAAEDLSEDEKMAVLQYGFKALSGEDPA